MAWWTEGRCRSGGSILVLGFCSLLLKGSPLLAQVLITPGSPILIGGEQATFRADPVGGPWQWSVAEPCGGSVDQDTGQYVAPLVAEVGRFHLRTSLKGDRDLAGEATITVLPRAPFEGVCPASSKREVETYPFLIPGATRRFGQDFLVRPWDREHERGCLRMFAGYNQPVTLVWNAPGRIERELLSYREGGALRCLEVTGRGALTIRPKGRIAECRVEALAHGSAPRAWKSYCRMFCVCVQGLLPYAGREEAEGEAGAFREPVGLVLLGGGPHMPGRFVVADATGHTLKELGRYGQVETTWGRDGEPGYRDGSLEAARFNGPTFLAVKRWFRDPEPWQCSNEFTVSDSGNHVIRKVDPEGAVTTLAGAPGEAGHRDAERPHEARFSNPQGLVMDLQGDLYVADQGNHVIRRINRQGQVTTLAGCVGVPGAQDGPRGQGRFHHLVGLAEGPNGQLYAVDGHAIRRVAKEGDVTTVLGHPTQPGFRDRDGGDLGGAPCLRDPSGLLVLGRRLIIADRGNHALREFDLCTGALRTLAGDPACPMIRFGPLREDPSAAPDAEGAALKEPRAVAVSEAGDLYVTTGASVVGLFRKDP